MNLNLNLSDSDSDSDNDSDIDSDNYSDININNNDGININDNDNNNNDDYEYDYNSDDNEYLEKTLNEEKVEQSNKITADSMKLAKWCLFFRQKISNQVVPPLFILEDFSNDNKNEYKFQQDIRNRIKNLKKK